VSIATGYATIALMLAGRLVFQYLGWGVAAATTPLVMAVTGGAFFAFSLSGAPETATLGVYAGAVTQACPAAARCLLAVEQGKGKDGVRARRGFVRSALARGGAHVGARRRPRGYSRCRTAAGLVGWRCWTARPCRQARQRRFSLGLRGRLDCAPCMPASTRA